MILVVRANNGSMETSVSTEETVEKRSVILSPKGEGSAPLQFPYAPRHSNKAVQCMTSCDGARPSGSGADPSPTAQDDTFAVGLGGRYLGHTKCRTALLPQSPTTL